MSFIGLIRFIIDVIIIVAILAFSVFILFHLSGLIISIGFHPFMFLILTLNLLFVIVLTSIFLGIANWILSHLFKEAEGTEGAFG